MNDLIITHFIDGLIYVLVTEICCNSHLFAFEQLSSGPKISLIGFIFDKHISYSLLVQ